MQSIEDGLTVFIGQGAYALDCACIDDAQWEVTLYKRKPECAYNDTFVNLSHMNGRVIEEFDVMRNIICDTREGMMLAVLALIREYNKF